MIDDMMTGEREARAGRRKGDAEAMAYFEARTSAEPGRVVVVDLDADWLDVGSWPALAHTLPVDGAGNAVAGPAVLLDAAGNVVLTDDPEHLVALIGVRDSVVVHTRDVTLVCPVADAERVKSLLAEVEVRYGTRYS